MSTTNTNAHPLLTRYVSTAKGVQELPAQCPDQAGMFARWEDVLKQSAEIKELRSALDVSKQEGLAAVARSEELQKQVETMRTPTERAHARVQAMIAQISSATAAVRTDVGEPSPTIQ